MEKICCKYDFFKPYDKKHYVCIKCGNIVKHPSECTRGKIDEMPYFIYKFVKDISPNIEPNEMPCRYLYFLPSNCTKCGKYHFTDIIMNGWLFSWCDNYIRSIIPDIEKIPDNKYTEITPIVTIDEFMDIAEKFNNDYDSIYDELNKRVIHNEHML